MIQVPVFELRDRRDALVLAVRRLSGTEIDTGNDDWGDALAAYRGLLRELQLRGAGELQGISSRRSAGVDPRWSGRRDRPSGSGGAAAGRGDGRPSRSRAWPACGTSPTAS